MYCQLELETVGGKVFKGPFIFRLEDGIRKLNGMGWLERTRPGKARGELRLTEVIAFPRAVIWQNKFDDEDGGRHDRRVAQAEWAWRQMGGGDENG